MTHVKTWLLNTLHTTNRPRQSKFTMLFALNHIRDQIVLQPLIAELHKVNTLANRSDWNPAPPVASAPTPAPAVVDTTSPRSPMEPIPEDGTPDLFEDLQNLPATPTPPTDQSMATSLS